jgi:stress-induced morphogen
MATVTRGPRDQVVEGVAKALDQYEAAHPSAHANLYRQNSASIRVRIVDARFKGLSKGKRHDQVWDFLSEKLPADEIQEISVLLLLAPDEVSGSFLNVDFEDPIPSNL